VRCAEAHSELCSRKLCLLLALPASPQVNANLVFASELVQKLFEMKSDEK